MAKRRFGIFKRDSEEQPEGDAGDAEGEDDAPDPEQDPHASFDPGKNEFVPPGEAEAWTEEPGSDAEDWALPDEDDHSDETFEQPAAESWSPPAPAPAREPEPEPVAESWSPPGSGPAPEPEPAPRVARPKPREIVIEIPGERSTTNTVALAAVAGAGVIAGAIGVYFNL
ncbi:MAG: hypothetical protein ACHQJ5_11355, partial [Vicinamibacteria bacterium]